jgi:hypothetical protein
VGLDNVEKRKSLTVPELGLHGHSAHSHSLSRLHLSMGSHIECTSGISFFFNLHSGGGGSKVHSTLRPLNGLLCQPRVIMMEKSVDGLF